MKKKGLLTILLLIAIVSSIKAQTITVGTGTSSSNSNPINRNYNYSASEQIYLGTEIGMTGTITSLAFQKASGTSGISIASVSIYMKMTASTTVTSPASTTGYTLVWSGTFPNSGTSGWQTVTLSTLFNFTSTAQNLGILIVKSNEAYVSSPDYPSWNYTTTTDSKSSYYNSDGTAWTSGSSSMTTTTSRPNVQLKLEMRVPETGNNSYTTCSGHLYDDGGSTADYLKNSDGYTVLYPGSTQSVVRLTGSYQTQSGSDFIYIYNGVGTGGTLLYSGSSNSSTSIGTITSTDASGALTVRFTSNGSNQNSGFDFTVACVCTTPGTPTTLSGSGTGMATASLSWAAGTPAGSSTITYYWELYNSSNTLITSGNTTATSANATGLSCGTSYYFKVYAKTSCDNTSSSTATSGNFTTSNCITNDECSGATSLTVNSSCSYATYDNTGSTASSTTPLPTCAGSTYKDIWFSFVVPSTGHVIIDGQTGGITDAGMEIYSGTCGSLTAIECDDDDSDNGAMPKIDKFGLTPGATIYIRFWEYGGDAEGTFGICVQEAAEVFPPSDDDCSDATAITVGNCANGTIENATNSNIAVSPCSGTADDDVWFSFIAADTCHAVTLSTEGSTDFYTQFFSGSCSGLTSAGCYDANPSATKWGGLTIGGTYYIRVYSYGTTAITGTAAGFTLCITTPTPPPSCVTNDPAADSCDIATLISNLNGYCGNTSASYDADTPGNLESLFCGSIDNNSWLKFVADSTTATLNIFVSNCTEGDGIQMQVFATADCSTFTSYSNCWNPGVMTDGTITATGLTVGNTYYLMIDGWAGDVCDFVISAKTGINLMPITLTAFKGKCYDGLINLSWTTATETNNDYFTIEKSTDAVNWNFFKKVKGSGNSNQPITYYLADESDRTAYYRLKQTDFDGRFEYFPPITVPGCDSKNDFRIYPNPVTDILYIETEQDLTSVSITDAYGQTTLPETPNLKALNMSDLKSGVYTIKIIGSQNNIGIFKVIKK